MKTATIATALVIGLLLFLIAGPAAASPCEDPVETDAGLVIGHDDPAGETCRWIGIPYAAPPVGELRWRPPQDPEPWSDLDANQWGPRCMQKGEMELVNADPSKRMSEDCLYLNVWRPMKSGNFPVMVWIHGGGLKGGTGTSEMYWGDRLAAAGDVVVVSINYRLNVFGFLAHPGLRDEDPSGATGGYGVLDQIQALEWVQKNIAGFGGDPKNVTIFGESAGGWSVCYLMATPLASGLFHRAIIESGGCQTTHALIDGYVAADEIARKLGCGADDLDCLRAVPAETMLKKAVGGLAGGFSMVAHIDGYLFTDSPLNLIKAGHYNHVPLLAGYNREEIKPLLLIVPKVRYATPANYEQRISDFTGASASEADEIADLYPLADYDNSPRQAFIKMGSDAVLACPTWSGMAAASIHEPAVFFYRFDYDQMILGKRIGAMHAMELPFVFDSVDRKPTSMLYYKSRILETRELVRTMQAYWTNFARNGNPNGYDLPQWPAFSRDNGMVQILDSDVVTDRIDNSQKCDYWEVFNNNHKPFWETLGMKQK